jgi:eukaryotic-like serine/threonine-protein kinase
MKRCPACNRVHDDALRFCPKDGTPLVDDGGSASQDAGTLRFGSAHVTGETETRTLPTGEAAGRPTAPTTVLDARRASSGARELTKPKSRRGVAIAAAAVAALVLAAFAYTYLSRGGGEKNSIAVLPFENASGDPEVEYLSDGITESIINSLSQLPGVRVMARSTMFSFKGKNIDPRAVGEQLGVEAVLTGRVVQRGDSLAVQADLVNVADGSQMWGEQFNRKLTDIVVLQGEVARDVSNRLRTKLTGADEQRLAKTYTANPEAYQHYLRGRFYWNKRTAKDLHKAVEYFQQAGSTDPNYAPAYAGLADAYSLLPTYGGGQPREMFTKAREAAVKALSLDSQLAEAHVSLGLVLNYYDYDFAGAEREFKAAIALNAMSPTAHVTYGNLLSTLGRHEEALKELRRALELDPLSLIGNRLYGLGFFYARRYEEAIAQLQRTVELDAGFAPAYDSLANVYSVKGDYAASVEAFAKNQELIGEGQNAALARESFIRGGWQGFLRAMTGERGAANSASYRLATYHAALGEKDEAFDELNNAYESREFFMILLKVDPRLDPLRSDPRFADLMRRVGFSQ